VAGRTRRPPGAQAGLVLQRQLVVTVVGGRVGGSGMFGPGAVVGVARSTSAGLHAGHGGEDEGGEQVADLVAAQRDPVVAAACPAGCGSPFSAARWCSAARVAAR